jgi:hypothetical protein
MSRHPSRSASYKGLLHDADEKTKATSASEDCEAPLVDSAPFRWSRKGICRRHVCWETPIDSSGAGGNIFTMKSGKSLRLLSLCFHSTLVVVHIALVPVWFRRLEHRVVFGLTYQTMVSFLITAVTQTFGTVRFFVLPYTLRLRIRNRFISQRWFL